MKKIVVALIISLNLCGVLSSAQRQGNMLSRNWPSHGHRGGLRTRGSVMVAPKNANRGKSKQPIYQQLHSKPVVNKIVAQSCAHSVRWWFECSSKADELLS